MSTRVMIFIDGQNLLHACIDQAAKVDKTKKLKIREEDFEKYLIGLIPNSTLAQVRFYTGIVPEQKQRYKRQEKYLRTLETKLKWKVDRKVARTYPMYCPSCRQKKGIQSPIVCQNCGIKMETTENKGVDVALATDLLIQGLENGYDVALLISGDRDFAPVIEKLGERRPNVKVIVVQFKDNASYELTDAAAKFHALDGDISRFADWVPKT